MWYQKDWFTGSDYYNLKEKQIHAEEIEIKKPLEQKFHEKNSTDGGKGINTKNATQAKIAELRKKNGAKKKIST